jgi:hypothetical protein
MVKVHGSADRFLILTLSIGGPIMGSTLKPVLFFSTDIVLDVHTASNAQWLGVHTLADIIGNRMARLFEVDNGAEFHVEIADDRGARTSQFATGPQISDPPIARCAIVYNSEDSEYRVKAYSATGARLPNSDYYTSDHQDAHDTARAMVAKQ